MAPAQWLPADPARPAARRIGRKTGVREDCPSRKPDTGRPSAHHTVRKTSSRRDCRRYTEGTSWSASTERRKLEIEIFQPGRVLKISRVIPGRTRQGRARNP